MKKISITVLISLLAMLLPLGASSQLITHSQPMKFIESDVHLLMGGSYVTENYKNCYPGISNINNSMGFAWGLGFGVKFNITGFFGFGTELNFLRNSGKLALAVLNPESDNISTVFINNNYRAFNIPIFASFTFNVAQSVKWTADAGIFMNFGAGGKQKATIYSAGLNDLNQLITITTHHKSDYYKSDRAFINSYRDYDLGLHIATGLRFMNKITLGVRGQFGFRNVAMSNGIVKPNSHNIAFFATAGYIF